MSGNPGNPGNNTEPKKRKSNHFKLCKIARNVNSNNANSNNENAHHAKKTRQNNTCLTLPKKCLDFPNPKLQKLLKKIHKEEITYNTKFYANEMQKDYQKECDIPWIDEEEPYEWDISIFSNSNATQPYEPSQSGNTPSSGGKKMKSVKKADKKTKSTKTNPKSTAKKSSSKKSGGKTEKKSTKKKAAKKTTKNTLLKKCDQKQGLA